MKAQDYEKILSSVPEILKTTTMRMSDEKREKVLDVADGVIGVSGFLLGGAALVASVMTKGD